MSGIPFAVPLLVNWRRSRLALHEADVGKAMWLVNVSSKRLEWFNDGAEPPYAILSHTWSTDEVTFKDMQVLATARSPPRYEAYDNEAKYGWHKITQACRVAAQDQLNYIWIDTCCIDKSSSAELTEAINSMFRWYLYAEVCYTFLEDVEDGEEVLPFLPDHVNLWGISQRPEVFCCARWFKRSWTLQELIAPKAVKFFDSCWAPLGYRAHMTLMLESITGVERHLLAWARDYEVAENLRSERRPFSRSSNAMFERQLRQSLNRCSIARRMSWASERRATRKEDEAYSLMGLFGVNLPLLYGESERAFTRLQQEIIKESTDQSIFAWVPSPESGFYGSSSSLLADSPACFLREPQIESRAYAIPRQPYEMTNLGLRIRVPILEGDDSVRIILNCGYPTHFGDSDDSAPLKPLITLTVKETSGICYVQRLGSLSDGLPFATADVPEPSTPWKTIMIGKEPDEGPELASKIERLLSNISAYTVTNDSSVIATDVRATPAHPSLMTVTRQWRHTAQRP